MLADAAPEFMLTYDHAPEIAALVRRHGFHAVQVTMKNTHHDRIGELVITRGPLSVAGDVPQSAPRTQGRRGSVRLCRRRSEHREESRLAIPQA